MEQSSDNGRHRRAHEEGNQVLPGELRSTSTKKDRKGTAVELNAEYFNDGIPYLKVAELEVLAPTLFDLEEIE